MDLVTIISATATPSPSSLKHPVILFENHLAQPYCVALNNVPDGPPDSDPLFPFVNISDGKEYTFWKSKISSNQSETFRISFNGGARLIDCLAIHCHNLQSVAATISIDCVTSMESGRVVVASAVISSSKTIMMKFDQQLTSDVRITINKNASAQAVIGVMFLGQSITMERGCWQGMTPPFMGRVTEVNSTVSQNGVLLGRSVVRKGLKFQMDFSHLTITFVRDYWMPFVQSAEVAPFFVLWNPGDYPQDAAFCWIADPEKDLQTPKISGHRYMTVGMKVSGRTEGII